MSLRAVPPPRDYFGWPDRATCAAAISGLAVRYAMQGQSGPDIAVTLNGSAAFEGVPLEDIVTFATLALTAYATGRITADDARECVETNREAFRG